MHLFTGPRNCSNKCNELDGESLESGPTNNEKINAMHTKGSLFSHWESWVTQIADVMATTVGAFYVSQNSSKRNYSNLFIIWPRRKGNMINSSPPHSTQRCYLSLYLQQKPILTGLPCLSVPCTPLEVIASKTGTFVAGSWVLLWHLDDLFDDNKKKREGKTGLETKDGDGLKERVELEKKGTYNMVKWNLHW